METYIFVFPQKQNGLYSFVSNPTTTMSNYVSD